MDLKMEFVLKKEIEKLAEQLVKKGIDETITFFDTLIDENRMWQKQRVDNCNDLYKIKGITTDFLIDSKGDDKVKNYTELIEWNKQCKRFFDDRTGKYNNEKINYCGYGKSEDLFFWCVSYSISKELLKILPNPQSNPKEIIKTISFSKSNIYELIANDRTEEALKVLQKLSENKIDVEELTLLSSRFNRLKKRRIVGTISEEEASLELNRINSALLEFTNSI